MTSLRVPLLTGLLATGLLLTGCGGESWPSSAGPVTGDPPTTAPAPTSAPDQSSEPAPSSAPTTPDDGGSGDATPATQRCTGDGLDAALGETTGEAGQRHTTVVWTNSSDGPCTMTGFGGVDLRGPDDPTHGPSYSLPRSSTEASPVRLEAGGTAHTVITWLPGGDWTPTQIVITPPDETTSKTLQWPGAAVERQDGATRPGTYIGPVTAGSA